MAIRALRDIDVGLLRTFVAVAETRRMTAAARVVSVSQGAVSQQIKRLERLLRVTLFARMADAARLTRDGEKLMPLAHRMIALNDEVAEHMGTIDFAGEVRLGVPHDVVGRLMPPILRAFSREHPSVLITLVSERTAVLRKLLRERSIDLALMTEAARADRGQHLMTDQLVWVGAKGGDAWRRRPLAVAVGQNGCAFRALAIRALNAAKIDWRAICQVGSLEPVFATLEADMAVAPFLLRTVPDRLDILTHAALPKLPSYHINLKFSAGDGSVSALELGRHIREGFARRYS
ncbi:MAG TPA: LysR substrate-binding domain-containing protein [Steroidobacteraceae bacterium]|nr:LysR substrate-binding domain-containing protein [Steroidobacteraceae bacterium]